MIFERLKVYNGILTLNHAFEGQINLKDKIGKFMILLDQKAKIKKKKHRLMKAPEHILESKSMHAIFQKKGKIFENLAKNA